MAINIETYTVTFYNGNEKTEEYENVSDLKFWGSEVRVITPEGVADSIIMKEDMRFEVTKE